MATFEIYNADCLEKMKDMPDKSVDLIICDLPYGCLIRGDDKIRIERKKTNPTGSLAGCAWDVKIDLVEFWKQVKRIRKNDHTPTLHFCNTKFGIDLILSNPKEFRYDLVWCKSMAVGFLSANKKPMSAHEMIYVFSKQGATYNRIDIKGGEPYITKRSGISAQYGAERTNTINTGTRCVKSWIEICNPNHKSNHPTAKPLELYKWLISRYSNEGDMVLDPTAGSFNSGEVCRELNRRYIGIEMNKEFYDKGVERFKL
jgi:site-specific DNA-methyltransferase (adenine-specific)